MQMLEKNLAAPPETDFCNLCSISGLPIYQRPEWVDVTFSANYKTTAFFVGDRIFVSRPSGYPRYPEIDAALNFTRHLTARFVTNNQSYVQIEDYQNLNGVSLQARRHFVSEMIKRDRIQALIFCNVEPVFKVIYQLAKRIPFMQKKVYLADDYPQALQMAFDILGHAANISFTPTASDEFNHEGLKPQKTKTSAANSETRRLADELLLFLTSVNWWEPEEIDSGDLFVDNKHPFYPVFAAVMHIKGELNELSQARAEAIDTLKEKEKELAIKARKLEETNIALGVLMQKKDDARKDLEKNVIANFQELVFPSLSKLKNSARDPKLINELNVLSANLDAIFSPFVRKLSSKYAKLTPMEIKVANLIKHGERTKDISESLNLSYKTVETHRMNIRKKLGLSNTKTNLRDYLQSL